MNAIDLFRGNQEKSTEIKSRRICFASLNDSLLAYQHTTTTKMMWATLITTTVVICAAVSPVNAAGNIFFQETFDDLDPFASGKWSKSGDDKYADQPVMIKGSDRAVAGWENDKGLSLTQEMIFLLDDALGRLTDVKSRQDEMADSEP